MHRVTMERVGGDLVLVAEDDEGLRELVRCALTSAGYRVETVAGGAEALAAARELRPDVLVLDVDLGALSGLEVCYQLRAELGPEFRAVFISGSRIEELDRTVGALLGGDAYLVKPFDPARLVAVVTGLCAGGTGAPPVVAPAERPVLSAREREILALVGRGMTRKAIGAQLGISPKTVASHLERITIKLGAKTQAHAVALAVADGLVSLD
jgi:DNA-binding NarL/FixJ family response regulator